MSNEKTSGEVQPEVTLEPAAPKPEKKPYRVCDGSSLPPSKIGAVLSLHSMGASKSEIARVEGISRNTVAAVVRQGDQYNPAVVERVKKHLAAHWYVTAERGLQAITDEKLEKSSAAALGVLASISTEKALLAEGKATSRVEFVSAGDQELDQQIAACQAELEQWRNGQILNAEGSMDPNVDTTSA